MSDLRTARAAAERGARLTREDALLLYEDNDLLALIAADPSFRLNLEDLEKTMQPERYTGRSAEQVTDYLREVVKPLLAENQSELGEKAEIQV